MLGSTVAQFARCSEEVAMEQLKDEFSATPVACPKCGKMATSVHKTGNKIFYNHGEPRVAHKEGQESEVTWKACVVDRPKPAQKS